MRTIERRRKRRPFVSPGRARVRGGRRQRVRISGLLCAGTALLAACAPNLTSLDQCQTPNYDLTFAKDEGLTGSWPVVDALMNDHVDRSDVGGCAVAVIEDRAITYIGTYGLAAAPPGDVGVKVHTVFPVGSISKPITALAIMTLLEDGHIASLDDPVGDYLDFLGDVRPEWSGISLRQLLGHGSGIAYWPGFGGPVTDANILALSHGAFASIRPELTAAAQSYGGTNGTAYTPIEVVPPSGPFLLDEALYSNVGYSLLGAVIDVVVQRDDVAGGYEDYVYRHVALRNDNVLTPTASLSMCLMPYWRTGGDIPGLSSRFGANNQVQSFDEFWGAERTLWGWEGPAGGWTMTIGDLARFALVLARSERLSAAGSQAMQSIHAEDVRVGGGLIGTKYALGLYADDFMGGPAIGHAGAIGGRSGFFRAEFAVRPDASFGLAMACNSGRALRNPANEDSALFGQVAAAILGGSGTPPIGLSDSELSPEARLWRRHGELLTHFAEAFRTPDGEADMEAIDRAIAVLPDGSAIQEAISRGDLTSAARLLDNSLDRFLERVPAEDLGVRIGPDAP